jgi:hypothetical protein
VDLKEGIWMLRTKYSVLKEKMKENECGWFDSANTAPTARTLLISVHCWLRF